MAIIIKNVDMPTKCGKCPFYVYQQTLGSICWLLRKPGSIDQCPLEDLNEKAEALIKQIEERMSYEMFDDWGNTTAIHDQLVEIIREFTSYDTKGKDKK